MKNLTLLLLVMFTVFFTACSAGNPENEKSATEAGASAGAAFEKKLRKLEKPANPSNEAPQMLEEKDLSKPEIHSIAADIKSNMESGKMCATFNYTDIGLPCLRAYGKKSDCVWASGWGWVYFNDYEVLCAGATLTVCYSSRGMCG